MELVDELLCDGRGLPTSMTWFLVQRQGKHTTAVHLIALANHHVVGLAGRLIMSCSSSARGGSPQGAGRPLAPGPAAWGLRRPIDIRFPVGEGVPPAK